MTTLQVLDLLDKRSNEFKALADWRRKLVEHLGGPLDPITSELVEQAIRMKAYLDRLDRKALASRKPSAPPSRGDQRPGLRRQLSGIMKTLRVDRAEFGRHPSHGPAKPVASLDDLRFRPQRARKGRS